MRNKLGAILLSLAIAFGLWYYVITVVSPGSEGTVYNIPVVLEGQSVLEERGLMVTSVGKTTVDLTLSGNRSDLNQVNSSNITIKANLASIYEPGENLQLGYTITYPGSIASNAFVEQNKDPEYITVTVEKRVSKSVDVNVICTGELPDDFIALEEELVLDYDMIRITGPESVVDQISQAMVEVSLEDQTESVNGSYRFTLCDENGEPVDSELITVSTDVVQVYVPVRMVKTIDLVVNVIDGGGATSRTASITIDPEQIQVHGTAAALEDLDQIVLGTIHLADYAENAEVTFDIELPEGVTNRTGLKQATVKLEFNALSTKTFVVEGEDIQLLNVPEGMEVELTTLMLEIVVRGPSAEIASLELEDMTISVDFSNTEPGTSSRRVQIVFDTEHKNCGALGSYSIYATVHLNGDDAGTEEG